MNSHVVRFLERRKKKSSALRNGAAAATNAELEDGCDATAVLLKKGKVVGGNSELLGKGVQLFVQKRSLSVGKILCLLS